MTVQVRSCLSSPALDVMTFLNEVVQRYPRAISFAPGRPSERYFGVPHHVDGIGRWVEYRAASTGQSVDQVTASLGQYASTAGIIQELVARHLAADQGIVVRPESIVITTGCQEAMLIAMLGLMEPTTDTLLVSDPSYVGITGIAEMLGIPVHPVPCGAHGLCPRRFEEAIGQVRAAGRRPRALYDVPDFNNPLGTSMPVDARLELLRVATEHDVLILEDNPYGAFAYDHAPMPTLKSLDRTGAVLYLGSFAKTLFPGLRIGYLVADQPTGPDGTLLAAALTTVKSLTTVNTSSITQAIVGAALLEHDGSLAPVLTGKRAQYRANRDRMLAALAREFEEDGACLEGVSWTRPAGGFFLVLRLPFPFTTEQLERCAGDFGAIVCPMSFFSLTPGREHEVRLSFSYVQDETVDEGIARLARFVRGELRNRPASPAPPPRPV
ncbi:MAG: PLP-dependent aminotransferase family protein [Gemmatimonadaceae bacterium]